MDCVANDTFIKDVHNEMTDTVEEHMLCQPCLGFKIIYLEKINPFKSVLSYTPAALQYRTSSEY